MELGYSFHWKAGTCPELVLPNGRTLTLEVIQNVPYLPPEKGGRHFALAAHEWRR
jgi:hypothetical protein